MSLSARKETLQWAAPALECPRPWGLDWLMAEPEVTANALGARNLLLQDLEARNSEPWVLMLEAYHHGLLPPVSLASGNYCNPRLLAMISCSKRLPVSPLVTVVTASQLLGVALRYGAPQLL